MSKKIPLNRNQVWVFPPTLDECVDARDSVRFVWDFVGELDLGALGLVEDPSKDGRPHFAPEMLLCVWLLGWMERIHSPRRLERACRRDVGYMWLTGFTRPDHTTLWRFFAKNKALFVSLFKKIVRVAAHSGLVGMALHAIDGTKIQAASSTDTAYHKTRLEEALKKLDEAVKTGVEQIESAEKDVEEYNGALPVQMANQEERKQKIRQALEALKDAKTNHLHPAEADARMMKGRQNTRMGYNAQAVADHDSDLIVAQDVFNDQNDLALAETMLDVTKEILGDIAKANVLDAGYASGQQIDALQKRHLPIYAPFAGDSSSNEGFPKAEFHFDAERDVYVCPMGKELRLLRVEAAGKTKPYPRRVYGCSELECSAKGQCTKSKTGRTVKRSPYDDARERQIELQKAPEVKILMSLRKEIIEHAFGAIKAIQGFTRFTARGMKSAKAQWALVCSAYNLKKLHRMTLAGATLQFS